MSSVAEGLKRGNTNSHNLIRKKPLSPFLCQQFFKFHGYEIQKLIFYTVIRKHFKLGLGNTDNGLLVKEKPLRTEMDFQRRGARTSRLLTVRNEVIRENMGVTQTILEKNGK